MKMKKTFRYTIGIILFLIGVIDLKPAKAQVNVSVNINSQPQWGPANYDYVEYYYLPEVDVYYYVQTREYIYFNRGRWVTASHLPSHYHIDLYRTYKVVLNEPRPYMHHSMYKEKYGMYKHSYNKQSPNRDHITKGNSNSSKGKSAHPEKRGKGRKGK